MIGETRYPVCPLARPLKLKACFKHPKPCSSQSLKSKCVPSANGPVPFCWPLWSLMMSESRVPWDVPVARLAFFRVGMSYVIYAPRVLVFITSASAKPLMNSQRCVYRFRLFELMIDRALWLLVMVLYPRISLNLLHQSVIQGMSCVSRLVDYEFISSGLSN